MDLAIIGAEDMDLTIGGIVPSIAKYMFGQAMMPLVTDWCFQSPEYSPTYKINYFPCSTLRAILWLVRALYINRYWSVVMNITVGPLSRYWKHQSYTSGMLMQQKMDLARPIMDRKR